MGPNERPFPKSQHDRAGGFRAVLLHDFRPENPESPWLGWNDLDEPLREHPWLPPDARYMAETICELSNALGHDRSAAVHVLVTWFYSFESVLPFSGDDVIVFCLGDESGRRPSYAHDVALVAKTNGVNRKPFIALGPPATWRGIPAAIVQEAHGQIRLLPRSVRSLLRTIRLRRRPAIVEIPLGTFWLSPLPLVPIADRRYDLSFAGSMKNDAHQGARILPQKTRSRMQMIEAVERLRQRRPDVTASMRPLDVFSDVGDHRHDYSELMMQTRLALCPRGGARETYRVFEAAASGCVPITERLPKRDYYRGFPGVQLRTWSQLPRVAERLLGDANELRQRHEAALAWWRDEASPRATAARLARRLT